MQSEAGRDRQRRRSLDADRRTLDVVRRLTVGDDHVQPVVPAAHVEHDEYALRARRGHDSERTAQRPELTGNDLAGRDTGEQLDESAAAERPTAFDGADHGVELARTGRRG